MLKASFISLPCALNITRTICLCIMRVSPLNTHAGFPYHKILHNFPLFPFYLFHAQHVSLPPAALHLLLTDLKYFRNIKSSREFSLRNHLLPTTPLFCSHTPQTCLSQLVFKTLYSFITESSGGHLTFVSSNRPLHYGSSHKLDLRCYFHPVQVNNMHKLSSRSNCS